VDDAQVTVQVSGSLAANHSEALRDAVLSGLGIALLPDFTAQSHIQSRKRGILLPKWRTFAGALASSLEGSPRPKPQNPHLTTQAGKIPLEDIHLLQQTL
jgi:DNA-binding transcriptional LysR family regulator